MLLVIDRFEGDFAVCEKDDKTMVDIERVKLPLTAKEGDVIVINGDKITLDSIETKKRKLKIDKMNKDLWL
jgi:hypothetical protein